jgi:hypothetical protein
MIRRNFDGLPAADAPGNIAAAWAQYFRFLSFGAPPAAVAVEIVPAVMIDDNSKGPFPVYRPWALGLILPPAAFFSTFFFLNADDPSTRSVFVIDWIRFSLFSPGGGAPILSAVPSGAGGSLAAGTYFWVVTALGPSGETLGSNEYTTTLAGGLSSVVFTWYAVPGATSYRVYRGTSAGGENGFYAPGNVLTYTDTNAGITNGSPPREGGGLVPNLLHGVGPFSPLLVGFSFSANGAQAWDQGVEQDMPPLTPHLANVGAWASQQAASYLVPNGVNPIANINATRFPGNGTGAPDRLDGPFLLGPQSQLVLQPDVQNCGMSVYARGRYYPGR